MARSKTSTQLSEASADDEQTGLEDDPLIP
jgi:hypothetical protein